MRLEMMHIGKLVEPVTSDAVPLWVRENSGSSYPNSYWSDWGNKAADIIAPFGLIVERPNPDWVKILVGGNVYRTFWESVRVITIQPPPPQ